MLPITLSKDTVYATKPNIMAPEGSVAADIAAAAATRINDVLGALDLAGDTGVDVTVNADAVEVAS